MYVLHISVVYMLILVITYISLIFIFYVLYYIVRYTLLCDVLCSHIAHVHYTRCTNTCDTIHHTLYTYAGVITICGKPIDG